MPIHHQRQIKAEDFFLEKEYLCKILFPVTGEWGGGKHKRIKWDYQNKFFNCLTQYIISSVEGIYSSSLPLAIKTDIFN